jgi:ADP-heptose:LPS heptosyltransferase
MGYCRKVVVIRTDDKLGETLLATPVFQAVKEWMDNIVLEAWLHHRWKHVVEGSPYLDVVRGMTFRPSWWQCCRLAWYLRRNEVDTVLILRPGSQGYMGTAAVGGARVRAGIVGSRSYLRFLLTHVAELQPKMHQVERNLAVVEAVVGRNLPRYPLHFTPVTRAPLPSAVRELPAGSYAVIHLGTGGAQPRWFPQPFSRVADFLAERFGLTPVLTGSPSERLMSQQCSASIHYPHLDLTGTLSVLELAEVLWRARLLVSVDTGVVHLAAAVGTPCVTLHFCRDQPRHRWQAWQVANEAVEASRFCPGCTDTRCLSHATECVQSITTSQVLEAVERLLMRV